ncbi:MAG: hypothetical protein K6C40_04235 [Thermoguttaceae bacterium]|nr:hypothetical protein [Thermoguttaceae bacterium]
MKSSFLRLSVVLSLVLTLCLFAGCGSKEKKEEKTESPAAEAPAAPGTENTTQEGEARVTKPADCEKAAEELAAELRKENPELENVEAPIQMTYYFIRALQLNNQKALFGMLTEDAYREMSAHTTVPCPEFIQNSDVQLGKVQYLSDENDESKIVGARVGTTWNVQTEEGAIQENIAWVFRFEDDAWLVAGMVSVLDPQYPPILINFEDLKETEQQLAQLDKEIEKINAEAAAGPVDSMIQEPNAAVGTQVKDPAVQEKSDLLENREAPKTSELKDLAAENGEENAKSEEIVSPVQSEEVGEELPMELPAEL